MKVLLSIRPEFANKIFSGEKKYEFRRVLFKKAGITNVVVYASSPVCKVIGEFEIGAVLTDEVSSLWKKTRQFAGITEDFFYSYFATKSIGHAIKVKKTIMYNAPIAIEQGYGIKPPQSFAYINSPGTKKNKKDRMRFIAPSLTPN
ncbi:MAG: hypothetical protein PHC61_07175 [Chitinivibrionales bacterium]|nr:hypothetical protein [Chitinivibrionales bacterium]